MKKRMFAMVLCAVMVCSMFAAFAPAASAATTASGMWGENLSWTLDSNGTLTISGTGEMKSTLASSYSWYPHRAAITAVVVSEGVTSVEHYAFEGYSALKSVTLPASVKSIDWEAFAYCSALTDVKLVEGLETIDNETFSWCTSLKSITIPASVNDINDNAFLGCTNLERFQVAEGNERYCVDEKGVLYTKDMETLLIAPAKLSGDYIVADGVETIEGNAFYHCAELKSLTISKDVKSIWNPMNAVFRYCTGLERFVVAEGNERFSNDANGVLYQNDMKILVAAPAKISGEYTIPASTEEIYELVFADCSGLTSLAVQEANTKYAAVDGVLYNKDKTELIACPVGKTGEFKIPDGVTSIADHAFEDCSKLTSMTVPASVTNIVGSAFRNCTGLESLTFEGDAPEVSVYEYTFTTFDSNTGAEGYLTNLIVYWYEGHKDWKTPWQKCEAVMLHNYASDVVVTAPTCTEQGYTTHTCSICGESKKDTYVDALGHDFQWITDKAATATENGSKHEECTRCKEKRNENTVIPATGGEKHEHSYTDVVTAPTCTEKGYTTHTCSCGDSYKDNYVDAKGHTVVIDQAVAATCTAEGKTEGKRCSVCNTVIVEQKTIAKTAHTYKDGKCTVCGACDGGEKCPSKAFKDNPINTWYHSAVDYVVEHKLFNGMSTTEFQPDTAMSRAMFVRVLWNFAGQPKATKTSTFTDVSKGIWYADAVAWAQEKGIAAGEPDNTFGPDKAVTREQMAAFFYRYAEKNGVDMTKTSDLKSFEDKDKVSGYAEKEMKWAVAMGIISGDARSDGKLYLDPQGSSTRAQVASVLMRYIEKTKTTETNKK